MKTVCGRRFGNCGRPIQPLRLEWYPTGFLREPERTLGPRGCAGRAAHEMTTTSPNTGEE